MKSKVKLDYAIGGDLSQPGQPGRAMSWAGNAPGPFSTFYKLEWRRLVTCLLLHNALVGCSFSATFMISKFSFPSHPSHCCFVENLLLFFFPFKF